MHILYKYVHILVIYSNGTCICGCHILVFILIEGSCI
jgi:hypothetical protein